MSQNLSLFDIKRYLEDKNIRYSTSGPNIGHGWIGITCPECQDSLNHFGINLSNKLYSCWKCGTRGNPFTFVRMVEGTTDSRIIQKIVNSYISGEAYYELPEPPKVLDLPDWFVPLNSNEEGATVGLALLRLKGFDSLEFTKRYGLLWGGTIGDFKWRVVIPIFVNGQMVNFTARTVANIETKYKSCPNARTPISINHTLYGYDEAEEGKILVVVEGIFDQWRLQGNSLAQFGLNLTSAQANLLRKKHPKKVVFLYDSDVAEDPQKTKAAERSMEKIWFCPSELVTLKDSDPGDLPWHEAKAVMDELTEGG